MPEEANNRYFLYQFKPTEILFLVVLFSTQISQKGKTNIYLFLFISF